MRKSNYTLILKGLLLLFIFSQLGCGFYFQEIEDQRAQKALKNKDHNKALEHFTKILKRSPESDEALSSARTAIKIAETNEVNEYTTISFLQHLVLYSKEQEERVRSQERIADIFYDKLNDYEKAIVEYTRLLALPILNSAKIEYRTKIARSFYYLNKFDQAISEVNVLLKEEVTQEQKFNLLLFRANVFLTQKKSELAIVDFRNLLKEFPEESNKERIGLIIAIAYEDMNEFEKAIEVLDEIKPDYDDPGFLEIKIKRLQERILNQPGRKKGVGQ